MAESSNRDFDQLVWSMTRRKYLDLSVEDRSKFLDVLAAYRIASDSARVIITMIEESKKEEYRIENELEGELTLQSFNPLGIDDDNQVVSCGDPQVDEWAAEVGCQWPEKIIGFLNANPTRVTPILNLLDESENTEELEGMRKDWESIDQIIQDNELLIEAAWKFIPLMFGEFSSQLGEVALNGDYFSTDHSVSYKYFLALCNLMRSCWSTAKYISVGGTVNSANYMPFGANLARSTTTATVSTIRRLIDTFGDLAPSIASTIDSVREDGIMALAGRMKSE